MPNDPTADNLGSLSVYLNALTGSLAAQMQRQNIDLDSITFTREERDQAQKLGAAYIDAATAEPYDKDAFIAARDAMIVQNAAFLDRSLPAFEKLLGAETVAEKVFYYTDDGQPRGSAMAALRALELPNLLAAFEKAESRGKAPAAPQKGMPRPKKPF